MRDVADIRARRDDGGTIRGISRDIGAARNTVRRAIRPDTALQYQRTALADQWEPAVRDMLADNPWMSVPALAERLEWPGSHRQLARIVLELRPAAIERALEGLNRPLAGTMKVGAVRTGTMVVGRVQAGPLSVGRATIGTVRAGGAQ